MKANCLYIVEDIKEMGLYGVGVTSLAQNFEQSRIGHKEETRKKKSFFLQIAKLKKSVKQKN